MKKLLLTVAALLTLILAHGQKTEYRISFNSGLFSFAGYTVAETTSIDFNEKFNMSSTNNPYGPKGGLCYGMSANIQRVTKHNLIFGVDLGYETLRSKISIEAIWVSGGTEPYGLSAEGQTFLNSNCTNIYPFIGYRIIDKTITLDFTGGIDIAHILSLKEDGEAIDSNGKKYETSREIESIKNDVRPRIQLSAGFKKIGLYAGYSYGLKNYLEGYIPVFESRARLLRFGLTYKIN